MRGSPTRSDEGGAAARSYYIVLQGGVPVGFAWLTDEERGFQRSECRFGPGLELEPMSRELAARVPPGGSWFHLELSPSKLGPGGRPRRSLGWWHMHAETARALTFSCMPARLHSESGELVYRSI